MARVTRVHARVRSACAAAFLSALVASSGCTLLYPGDRYDEGANGAAAGEGGIDGSSDRDARTAADATPGPGDVVGCRFQTPVRHLRNASGSELFTTDTAEAATFVGAGYSDLGIAFYAAASADAGDRPVYRLLNPNTNDRIYTLTLNEKPAAAAQGYSTDEGAHFYAAGAAGAACVVPVQGFQRLGHHTLTTSDTEAAAYRQQGWTEDGKRFYAGTTR